MISFISLIIASMRSFGRGRPRTSVFAGGIALLVCLFHWSGPLHADTVILRDGTRLKGKIIRVSTGSHMVMRVRGRVTRIPLKNVRSLKKARAAPRKKAEKIIRRRRRPRSPAPKASAVSRNAKRESPEAKGFRSPWIPGLIQYREGRRIHGAALGGTFAAGLLASLYYSLKLASIRREAEASAAYNLFLDRTIDNRFRRVRGRLDGSRALFTLAAALHGWEVYRAAKSGPTLKAGFRESGGVFFGLRFHF